MSRRTTIAGSTGWIVLLFALVVGTALPGSARAGERRTHDGFFLRLSGGLGGANTSLETGPLDAEISGRSGDFNMAIGGIIGNNLALHGTFFGWATTDPDLDVEGLGSTEIDGDLSMSGVGGGLTYYFMPANIYLSGSLGAAWLSVEGDEELEGESDTGIAGELTLGKEWWLGGSWGLGLAGAFGYHTIPDDNINENWSGTSWAIRFSATLN